MNNVIGFQCVKCAHTHNPHEIEYVCPACGGNLEVLYDYDRIGKSLTKEWLAANRDLTMWRYRALLPIGDTSQVPPLSVGWTPIYDCPELAAKYAVGKLFLKDEGRNPTGSLKDRPSALAVVKAREAGKKIVATASSGNAGAALAGMCASMHMKSVIFVPIDAPDAKLAQLQVYGSTIATVVGTYDQAFDLCLSAARQFGWYQRNTGYNPYMTEGKKTAALEIAEQLGWKVPDKVIVSMGDGCIMGGLWKGFRDLYHLGFIERLPQMIGVQAEDASAIVNALSGYGPMHKDCARTIADSICVGEPRDATKAIRAINESAGIGVKVTDDEILAAIGEVASATGVFVEPAAAAAFAGFKKCSQTGSIKPDESVLVLLTGNGLKDVKAVERGRQTPFRYSAIAEEFVVQFKQNGFDFLMSASSANA